MGQEGYRVGVDVGGTFTDLICITPDDRVLLEKTPTTPDDQSVGVLTGLRQLADTLGLGLQDFCGGLEAFVHGTTTADNTMIEMSGPITGLLATEGHRDEIELRRDHKEEIWDPAAPPPLRSPGVAPASPFRGGATSKGPCCCPLTRTRCGGACAGCASSAWSRSPSASCSAS